MSTLANRLRRALSHRAMCWVSCVIAAASLSACGGGGDDDSEQLICDGTEEIRFAFADGGGRLSPEDAFGGARFITIDGHCNFWVREPSLRGLRTGVLDAGFASQLSSELHIGQYASVQSYVPPVCPDGGATRIWDGSDTLEDNCAGASGAPRVWGEAFDRAWRLFAELAPRSSTAWERTRILPLRDADRPDELLPLEWTASFDLDSNARSVVSLDYLETGVLVEDAPTLAVLAELRLAAIEGRAAANPGATSEYLYPGLFVIDAQEREFQVLLYDEPPEAVVRAAPFALEDR